MGKKKILVYLFLPLLLASFLHSQSLADLAKKEKVRRAALKGKGAAVTTSADLAKVKRKPAVESAVQEQTAEEAAAQVGQGETPPAAGQPAAAVAEKLAAETPPGETPAMSEKEFLAKQAELGEASKQKQEMVELLALKLNSLYQEFYGLDNMKSREILQIQISDTYDKLLKSETDAKKAAKDLEDFSANTKRENIPDIWIK
ncbi:MAG: hypothetical protein IMZ57_11430 [Acidobacteria bacterium]|nr:hypothetical protein [Acidobacteriota bacterium]